MLGSARETRRVACKNPALSGGGRGLGGGVGAGGDSWVVGGDGAVGQALGQCVQLVAARRDVQLASDEAVADVGPVGLILGILEHVDVDLLNFADRLVPARIARGVEGRISPGDGEDEVVALREQADIPPDVGQTGQIEVEALNILRARDDAVGEEIGRASCRERVF